VFWTFHWQENHPIATYLLVFAAADYAIVQDTFSYGGHDMPILHYVWHSDSANAHETFSNVPTMLEQLSDSFGIYPFIDEKYGYVRLGSMGWAMENQTNVFWGLSITGHNYEEIVAHEAAHMWFGDAVGPGSFKDVWLNEGFATFYEPIYVDQWSGGVPYHDYVVGMMNYYLAYENYPVGHPFPIYDPPDLYNPTTYEKGACVLHMLRHVIGDEVFFDGMRAYVDSFLHEVAVTDDFIAVMEDVSGQDLGWFFDEWLFGAGHPEYEWSYTVDPVSRDSIRIDLRIDQVQPDTWDIPVFTMPIDLEIYHETGDTTLVTVWDSLREQDFEIYVTQAPSGIGFDPDHWILKEAQFAVEEDVPARLSFMNLAPSIARDGVSLSYGLASPGALELEIYDCAGRRVRCIRRNHGSGGEFEVRIDTRELSAGVYFYRTALGVSSETMRGRFVVVR
jgi:aminopeptidase N